MSKTILIVPDSHATPEAGNERADYLAKLTIDLQPDIVVNLGDQWDLSSLSSYDKGTRSFQGRSYRADVEAGREFSSRWWDPVKSRKKKLPRRVFLIGNHEQRIDRTLDLSPELAGTVGYENLELDRYYDEVVHYAGQTPGQIEIEGIQFAHYFVTGVSGRPVSGERPAHMLLAKYGVSCIQGHTHILDYATRKSPFGRVVHGAVLGCYHDHTPGWAGNIANMWRPGVAILHNVEDGNFDFQWTSLDSLKKEYGDVN